ncbi:MAG: divalent anion:Na+ symporter (DASS) family transporter [Epulopiscium sp. Nele67-Bin005]|nr:MAG: divalent anion:Na+ symporter (DASS) family transporter [Epulopiscium sp. Nele67-Bin005]
MSTNDNTVNTQMRIIHILLGPLIFLLCSIFFANALSPTGAQSIGVLFWMIFWWIARPVDITITGMLPVIINAIYNIVPMSTVTSSYVSDSIILIFGSGLLCMAWPKIGLDKRIALRTLSLIGPSMKSQITGWLLASIVLSTMMPNVAVCALFCPIAVSMFKAAGYEDITKCKPAVPILLAVGWGVSLGGSASPLGGAMNLVAISQIEQYTGVEFMYIDWVIRTLPYTVLASGLLLAGMLMMPLDVKQLSGTKEYFKKSYADLGPMKRDEIICAILFIITVVGAFLRPLYQDIFPALAPAYLFLIMGSLTFFISSSHDKNFLVSWNEAQEGTMWGMMILFGGGLALGQLINNSGASTNIASIISSLSLDGGITTIIVFVIVARVLSEVTNSTTSAAVVVPIVIGFATQVGLNVLPYWLIITMAFNAEFMLPISVRAIPVAYGLDASTMLKSGFIMSAMNVILVIAFGYIAMNNWSLFHYLSNFNF